MPTIVITGSTGQTGSYLVEELVADGWDVHGVSAHSIPEQISINHLVDVSDSNAFSNLLDAINPDAIVNLAAISNVATSWDEPIRTAEINCLAVSTCLGHVSRRSKQNDPIRFIQASSALILDASTGPLLNEETPITAKNPYAATKAFGHLLTQSYREAGCHASNAILFNHESPRRPPTFVTRKISQAVARISLGLQEELVLGPIDVFKDWGWAPDYAHALKLMLESDSADDYVIATGIAHSIREFLDEAFRVVNISDWGPLVRSDSRLFRPTEESIVIGDSSKIQSTLGWSRTKEFSDLVSTMVKSDLASYSVV